MKQTTAFAPTNIALVKYWGKRDSTLNLPVTDSLSLSLNLGTTTTITEIDSEFDEVWLNGERCDTGTLGSRLRGNDRHCKSNSFTKRIFDFISPYRDGRKIRIDTVSDIPVAAGLASSASGFAALTLAMNDFYELGFNKTKLSTIARFGSGSACRSLWPGIVKWQKGEKQDGSDSHGIQLENQWPELRMGVIMLSQAQKAIGSREGMIHCQKTSPLYTNWPKHVETDMQLTLSAIKTKDFEKLGETVEHSAFEMHRCMRASKPTIDYSLPETYQAIEQIQALRKQGCPVFYTQDAGPNIKVLYLNTAEKNLKAQIKNLSPL